MRPAGRLDVGVNPWDSLLPMNVRRCHLTTGQKQELVASLLKQSPKRSNRATAKLAQVSDKTVGSKRVELEERAEIPRVKSRADTAGRQQLAHKPGKVGPASGLHESPHAKRCAAPGSAPS